MTARLTVIGDTQPAAARRILEIRHLRKVFLTDGVTRTVLEDITFSAGSGELICILGRSGCGKTTLLNILAGFLPPTSGEVLLKGAPVSRPGPERAVVFQEDALFPWLTVRENIAFGLGGRRQDAGRIRAEVDRFLSLVGLSEFHNFLPRDISGGMKQRVALARVLILKPEILLMDEPFAALDAQTREEMQHLLLSLWETLSHTILFVTHDVTEAITLADRILLMDTTAGTIRDDIRVDLARPRHKHGDGVLRFQRRLFEALRT